jgi:hypothetical protein
MREHDHFGIERYTKAAGYPQAIRSTSVRLKHILYTTTEVILWISKSELRDLPRYRQYPT